MEGKNSVSCKLKIPKNLSGKIPPFLVDFSNGNVNLNCPNKLNFTSFWHVNDKNIVSSEASRVLIANNDRLNYESSTVDNSNLGRNKMRYFLGVRNKASGKMKVYDTVSFHLKPASKTDLQSSTAEERNLYERLDDLTASFGSKNKKRSMNAQQKYSTDQELLDHALEDIAFDDSLHSTSYTVSISNTRSNIEYIPPQNRNANSVDEVYNVSDIISAEEDDYLNTKARLLIQDLPTHLSQWKIDGAYCEYVLKHLESSVEYVKVKYLLYYNYLVIFSRLMAADIKRKDPAPQIPEPIKSNLLGNYTVTSLMENGKTIRSFPMIMKDKLLAYILVLALIIDDYSINLALVQNGMKYGMSKISNVAQVLGCYITQRKSENSAIKFADLKLPLFVPQKYYKKN